MDGVLEAAGYTPGAVRSPPLSTRTALGPPLEHIFSHVRHTMHVEACDLSSHVDARSPSGAGRADEDGSEGGLIEWACSRAVEAEEAKDSHNEKAD